ncbi:MAG: hypothetical protein K1X35_12015 [Caulobacteraceae bacterium]|nr:hypothetical protein [Caulobacteraceae bacterium]
MIRFRKRACAQAPRLELAAEIAETLFQMGGAAHRDRVVEAVLADRRNRGLPADDALKVELVDAFACFCDLTGADGLGAPMFTLPFGPNTLRWALKDDTARYGIAAPVVSLRRRTVDA